MNAVEELPNRAHGEEYETVTVSWVGEFGKRESFHQNLDPTSREMELGQVIAAHFNS